ncbi:hypothetical protein GL2_02300 [Microbulbifer sp. GL-2]|nr:hypothetical protein GL2_02300 [Microbulbifer sp. GL-2]
MEDTTSTVISGARTIQAQNSRYQGFDVGSFITLPKNYRFMQKSRARLGGPVLCNGNGFPSTAWDQ